MNLNNFLKKYQKYLVFLCLAILLITSSWSLFRSDIGTGHDYVHGARILEFVLALKAGHFPPVWAQNFAYGYGMPLFEFYAPLPFFTGAIFNLLGFSITNSVKALFLICNLGTIIGAYYLGRQIFKNDWAGVLAAAGISLAPYRAVDLFVRGAVSESWAIMALPIIMLGTCLIIDRVKKGSLILILGLVILMLSHNLSVMICLPFMILWAIIYYCSTLKSQDLISQGRLNWAVFLQKTAPPTLQVTSSYLLAISLSAFYLIPAFTEKSLTQVETFVINDYFNFHLHFLYLRQFFTINWGYGGSGWGPDDGISFFLGTVQLISLLIALMIIAFVIIKFIIQKYQKPQIQKTNSLKSQNQSALNIQLIGIIFLLSLSLFLATMKSNFIWENISLFAYIQFPWRYLAVSLVFVGVINAFIFAFLPKKFKKIFFVLSFSALIISNYNFFRPEKYLNGTQTHYYENPYQTRKSMSGVLIDYLPSTFDLYTISKNPDLYDFPAISLIASSSAQSHHLKDHTQSSFDTYLLGLDSPETLSPEQITDILADLEEKEKATSKVTPDLEIMLNRPHQKLLNTNFVQDDEILILNLAAYPGWTLEVDGQIDQNRLITDQVGRLNIIVPAGQHQLGLILKNTPLRSISQFISFISIIYLIFLIFNLSNYTSSNNVSSQSIKTKSKAGVSNSKIKSQKK